jgi:hypothetical protein
MLIDAKPLGIDARSLVATRNAEKLLGVDLHGAEHCASMRAMRPLRVMRQN